MTHLVSAIQKFIYPSDKDNTMYVINGSYAAKDQKTEIDGTMIVQLRKARTEESGFNWEDRDVKEVHVEDVMVVDDTDIAYLVWFIQKKVKIIFSDARLAVSPLASTSLTRQFNRLHTLGIKAVPGSTITVPIDGGLSGMARSEACLDACKKLGFEVSYG